MSNRAATASEMFNFLSASRITGETSYDVWKSINPEGTEIEFLEELRGDSSYDFWLSLGYEGTPDDFLKFMKGKSAYETAKAGGFTGTEEEFAVKLNDNLNSTELNDKITELKSDFTKHTHTASDVGAISYNKVIDVENATAVLEVANSMSTGGSFTAINGQPICTAEDAPLSGYEFHYLVLQDEFGRKRVIAISFSDNNFEIFIRRIFNGAWLDDSWKRLTDVFFRQSGGTVNGDVIFNSGAHIAGGTDDVEGGQMSFEVPRNGNFSSSVTMDVCRDQFRWFAIHAGTLKQFILDFSLFESGNATVYTTKSIIGSDADITAGISPLTIDFIYQVYE